MTEQTPRHTPLGWRVSYNGERNYWEVRSGITVVASEIEWKEDAIRIAAAPDLLGELKGVVSIMTTIEARLRIERDEATGETYCCGGLHEQLVERIESARAFIAKAKGTP